MSQTEFLWTRDTSIELAILSLILVKQMDSVLLKLVIQAQHTIEVLPGRKYSWDIVRYEMLLKVHTAETNSTHVNKMHSSWIKARYFPTMYFFNTWKLVETAKTKYSGSFNVFTFTRSVCDRPDSVINARHLISWSLAYSYCSWRLGSSWGTNWAWK